MTTTREDKLNKRFDLMDANGNGYLERDDYEALARRLVQGFALPPGSPKGRAVIDTYLGFWKDFIAPMDADGDGRVSREEFVGTVVGAVADGDGFDRAYRPHISAVVELCDTDDDGSLSGTEFARLMGLYGVGPGQSADTFAQLDRDGDGQLTVSELADAARDFYLSTDPASPGSALFGRI